MKSPSIRRDMTTDLASDTASRGKPADWVILRDSVRVGRVSCPDAETAHILATFRHGADVTVQRAEGDPS